MTSLLQQSSRAPLQPCNRRVRSVVLACLLVVTVGASLSAQEVLSIDELALVDEDQQQHLLSAWHDKEFVVLAFVGLQCPLSKLYAERLGQLHEEFAPQGVAFMGIVANEGDTAEAASAWAAAHRLPFRILRDPRARVADACGVTVNPEVVVFDPAGRIRYRGRIDDQYLPGLSRAEPQRQELLAAIDDLLANRPVAVSRTDPVGCFLQRPFHSADTGTWTYEEHVREIVAQRCVDCHRPGQKAPFPLLSYDDLVDWRETIRWVLEDRRMPPWYADPAHGTFANRAAITEHEREVLLKWLDDGMPRGEPQTPGGGDGALTTWTIPTPDLVISMPEPFRVPATGVIDYQYFLVDLRFADDLWVQAAEIRPGNPQVVHHAGVFLVPPGSDQLNVSGELGSVCLVMDSIPQLMLPEGRAKRIPAGARLLFLMHYTAVGTEQIDQTSLGLVLADPKDVRQEVATHVMVTTDLEIPPHDSNYRREMVCQFDEAVEILSLFPHMHYRGKSFRYVAEYPNGRSETLLSLPRWDFNWQHNYILSEPKRLPAGTMLRAIAHYDNSANNLANPDPTVTVRTGQQSWDEMFNAYYDFVLADQDRRQSSWVRNSLSGINRVFSPLNTLLFASALLAVFMGARRQRGAKCG